MVPSEDRASNCSTTWVEASNLAGAVRSSRGRSAPGSSRLREGGARKPCAVTKTRLDALDESPSAIALLAGTRISDKHHWGVEPLSAGAARARTTRPVTFWDSAMINSWSRTATSWSDWRGPGAKTSSGGSAGSASPCRSARDTDSKAPDPNIWPRHAHVWSVERIRRSPWAPYRVTRSGNGRGTARPSVHSKVSERKVSSGREMITASTAPARSR